MCLNQRQVAVRDRRCASSAPGARVLHSLVPPQPWARAASVCQYIDWVVSRTAEEDPADPLPRVMRDGLVWLDLRNRTVFDGQFVDTGSE